MPWKRTRPVDERLDFIAAHHSGLYSMSELCLRFGISRETGYQRLRLAASESGASSSAKPRRSAEES